jgi:flagellar assembly factor FliW
MEVLTTRFGPIQVDLQDRVEFPRGIVGMPHLRRFVIWNDPEVPAVRWLQSTREPGWALAMLEPRLVVPTYQVRATPDQLSALQITESNDVEVFVTLNRTVQSSLVNLQAPILINRRSCLGMQLVLSDTRYPVRYALNYPAALRKSA